MIGTRPEPQHGQHVQFIIQRPCLSGVTHNLPMKEIQRLRLVLISEQMIGGVEIRKIVSMAHSQWSRITMGEKSV